MAENFSPKVLAELYAKRKAEAAAKEQRLRERSASDESFDKKIRQIIYQLYKDINTK